MPSYTVNLSDIDKKAFDYSSTDVNFWIQNAVSNRVRKSKEEIISLNTAHCNKNSITIATGEDAQITQAYDLGVVKTAAERNSEYTGPE